MSRSPLPRAASLALALAVLLPPAFAEAQTSPELKSKAMALMKPCRPDFQRFCSHVQPGGGRVLACLKSHERELSPACGQAVTEAAVLMKRAGKAPPSN
ncbi:cysteine rich repeat-containing protein [Labrys monachus]|uniref:Cysteine rich repeat-containing protein n=1 Tax=Labrys monachus TaxID=217067 RepID=A0ABU0FG57_9HYPH|nr:cysteine rich repeat-containing protein [Labrys monachus]MDQ0393093.1 hypothetical protein [Labrys monachus]